MKQTSKRILALLLALSMAFSLLSVSVWAADESEDVSVLSADASEVEEEAPAEAEPEAEAEEPEAEEVAEEPEEAEVSEAEESEAEPEAVQAEEEEEEEAEDEAPAEEAEADESAPVETQVAAHTHTLGNDEITFLPWTDEAACLQYGNSTMSCTTCLPMYGSYYLTEDVDLWGEAYVQEENILNLCLNGHSITQTAYDPTDGTPTIVVDNGVLNLFDEAGDEGVITHDEDSEGIIPGSGVVVQNYGIFNMFGGKIADNYADTYTDDQCGAGVFLGWSSCTFNMYGGEISGNTTSYRGGGVGSECDDSVFNLYGGSINNNHCLNEEKGGGGGVYLSDGGTFNMEGGDITENSATNGGGVCIAYHSIFQMKGGEIANNIGVEGGGVCIGLAESTMTKGTITGNSAEYGGGVVVLEDSDFSFEGGSITENSAMLGGGVSVLESNIEQRGTTISKNFGLLGGGLHIDEGSTAHIYKGDISENLALVGGGVANLYSQVACVGGSIEKNEALAAGGVVNLGMIAMGKDANKKLSPVLETISDDESASSAIKDNTAMFGGGLVCSSVFPTYVMGGSITGNKAAKPEKVLANAEKVVKMLVGNLVLVDEEEGDEGENPETVIVNNLIEEVNKVLNGEELKNLATALNGGGGILYADATTMGAVLNAALPESVSAQVAEELETLDDEDPSSGDEEETGTPIGLFLSGDPVITGNTNLKKAADNVALLGLDLKLPEPDEEEGEEELTTEEEEQQQEAELPPAVMAVEDKLSDKASIGVTKAVLHVEVTDNLLQILPYEEGEEGIEEEKSMADTVNEVLAMAPDYIKLERIGGVFTAGLPGNGSLSSFSSDSDDYVVALTDDDEGQLVKAVKASAENVTATYDGKAHSITVKAETEGAKVSYSTDGKTYTATNPTFTNAGTYTVYYKAEAEGCVATQGKATVIIKAKSVTATAANKSSVYGKNLAALTYTVTGLVNNADKAGLKITASTKATKTSDVGKYDITLKQGSGASKNYKVTLKKGTYTIKKAKWATPAAPKVTKKSANSLTVQTKKGQQYSLDKKKWQTGGTFSKLTAGKTYTVYTRKAADKNHTVSDASKGTKVALVIGPHLSANTAVGGSKVTVHWQKRSDADSYEVTVWYCGTKQPDDATVTVKGKNTTSFVKIGGKNVDAKKSVTVQVVAKKNGKVVAQSVRMHVAGASNKKLTNPKGVKDVPSALILNLKNKKTQTLAPKTVKQNAKRDLLGKNHADEFRLVSSNPKVAKANGKKVIAVGKGSCTIYAVALNGVEKAVQVTVK